ncbi:MAG: YceI family protein [Pseudomonas fluorescens]|nr:YceI family protein [Pseudomonas fluorescens]
MQSNALHRWLALTSLTALASCTLPQIETPRQIAEPVTAPAGAHNIDPAASTLHILVYRGGPMAALGHNHVISSRNLQGSIWRAAALEGSGFDIQVPVNDLVVDDSAARAAEGEDFAAAVSEDAKAGTKANMLRETLLDAARYPQIRIRSVSVQGNLNTPTVVAAIQIRDQTRLITLPVTVTSTASTLRVTGAFEIRQTDFGITPLRIAMGALQVQDSIKIKFELVATAP